MHTDSVVKNVGDNMEKEQLAIQTLTSMNADGIIIGSTAVENAVTLISGQGIAPSIPWRSEVEQALAE